MRIKIFIFIMILLSAYCAQEKNTYTIRFPYEWLDVPGYGGDIDQQKIVEPSDICYHPVRKTLFVVSDEGEITEIETDGKPVSNTIIPGDLEGITVDPESGYLYVMKEGDDVLLEFDPERQIITREFPIKREYQGNPNFLEKRVEDFDNGIESLAFVSDENHPEGGTFYMGNQWDPPCILEVFVPLKSSQSEISEARILRVLPFKIDDPAAMYYDAEKGLLNIVSDADNILVEITLDGKLIKEYAFLGDNQEGLARDEVGYLYIAQDTGGIIKVKDLR